MLIIYCLALIAGVTWPVARAVRLLNGSAVALPGDGSGVVAITPDGRTLYVADRGPVSDESGHTVTPVVAVWDVVCTRAHSRLVSKSPRRISARAAQRANPGLAFPGRANPGLVSPGRANPGLALWPCGAQGHKVLGRVCHKATSNGLVAHRANPVLSLGATRPLPQWPCVTPPERNVVV